MSVDYYLFTILFFFFFFTQKAAYEMRISDWSSDVCSSDLGALDQHQFCRAPTDIEDHCRAHPLFEQNMTAEHREPRFLARADDIERDAGLLADPLDEGRPILGAAAGFCRHRTGEEDVAAHELVRTDPQGRERAVPSF